MHKFMYVPAAVVVHHFIVGNFVLRLPVQSRLVSALFKGNRHLEIGFFEKKTENTAQATFCKDSMKFQRAHKRTLCDNGASVLRNYVLDNTLLLQSLSKSSTLVNCNKEHQHRKK